MISPPLLSSSYKFVLTTIGFVSLLGCVPPEPRPTPIVTLPVASADHEGLSAAPADTASTSRPSRRMWTWETDVRDARARATRERAPLVVYVRADWSAGALAMDRNVWSDSRILFHPLVVVPLRVDVTDGPNAEFLAEELRIQAVPTTILFDSEGREVQRLEGARSVDEVLRALRQLGDDTPDR